MNPEVRTMLEGMYAQVRREFKDPEIAWDRFMEYIAAENSMHLAEQMPGFLQWLFESSRLKKALPETYDMKLHGSDFHDHLGEMYEERLRTKELRTCLDLKFTSMDDAILLASKLIQETERELSIYAPAAGTGRLLMAAHKRAPNAHLFGSDPDLRAVRIGLTNFAVYDIPGYMLHANATIHETDLSTDAGQYNWRFSNNWDSCMDKLHPRVRPPKSPSFSTAN